jgi:acyl-CoA thioester hydrolase
MAHIIPRKAIFHQSDPREITNLFPQINKMTYQIIIKNFKINTIKNSLISDSNSLSARYNLFMANFRFYHAITVRYGDLDPQGHVNNARYLTYLEQARVAYVSHLGLWDGRSFTDIGIILADVHLTFLAPILFGQAVEVGLRVSRLGNKSMDIQYTIQEAQTGQEFAKGSTVIVTYNYHEGITIPIPENWRKIIIDFERL